MKYLKALASKLYAYAVKYPVAIAVTIILVVGSIFMLISGRKFQIGGILGELWGTKKITPDVKLIPPSDRKDDKGHLIQPGESDDKGFVQVPVQVEIDEPGIFSDPNVLVINHPERGKEVIELPTGVKNEDVKTVVEISPKVYQIGNNDSGVNAKKLLDEIGG